MTDQEPTQEPEQEEKQVSEEEQAELDRRAAVVKEHEEHQARSQGVQEESKEETESPEEV